MNTSYEQFINEVAERAGVERSDAERAMVVACEALGRRLREVDARAVAAALPLPLAEVLLSSSRGDEFGLTDFERLVRERAPTPLVRTACRVLAESLDEQARTQLRMQALAPMFA